LVNSPRWRLKDFPITGDELILLLIGAVVVKCDIDGLARGEGGVGSDVGCVGSIRPCD
jgi:hypothetical protein